MTIIRAGCYDEYGPRLKNSGIGKDSKNRIRHVLEMPWAGEEVAKNHGKPIKLGRVLVLLAMFDSSTSVTIRESVPIESILQRMRLATADINLGSAGR